ncbi:TraR/DksA family transcriptional regulator [Fodinibius halophilus]|uniref:Molecular chaperone DnaK n=1 Tax=Fodinibius halophilus TaxID=1736908 RepID=A0A6M1T1C6_9BACT|nr:TraR/DksA C4-type zinc finger protein [Fodinibius halophilus]NGP89878.1 molecular chaperone DnaK [Fodinibius halophilus]
MKNSQKRKTSLSDKKLQYFKELLLDKRSETQKELDTIRDIQSNLDEADDADYSSRAHHMGDVGSEEQESEMNYLQIERLREYIMHINDALERIENKTYGICQATGKQIPLERLEAVPHTRYSMEAKEEGLIQNN